jgi:putative ABC transport system substrate-binding protein
MRRREFIALVGGTAALWPLSVSAQQADKVHRIGFLGLGTASTWAPRVNALRTGLREHGYSEGRNFVFDFQWADTFDRLRDGATELARRNVEVIFAMTSTEVEAARQATKTIPIVFATHADPVGVGHVASLARPGGNITGLTVVQSDLTAKALEIFKESLPHVRNLGVLGNPAAPSYRPTLQAVESASTKLGIQFRAIPVQSAEDFDRAFTSMAQERFDGFFVSASSLTLSARELLAALGLKHRLPGVFGARDNITAGGFMSYAPDAPKLVRRAAFYIDKILTGTKPADLPVEQASQYQLTVNLKTAKVLGIALPPTILARADEVIE